MNLMKNIKALLKVNGLSAREVSLKIGSNPTLVNDILSGKSTDPQIKKIEAIAHELGTTVQALIGDPSELLTDTKSGPVTQPVHQVPVLSWEEAGTWLSNIRTFNPDQCEEFHQTLATISDKAFALDVYENDMCTIGTPSICEGARVTIDPDKHVKNGDIVLVLPPEEGAYPVLKKLTIHGAHKRLVSLNPDPVYADMELTPKCQIIGVAVSAEQVL